MSVNCLAVLTIALLLNYSFVTSKIAPVSSDDSPGNNETDLKTRSLRCQCPQGPPGVKGDVGIPGLPGEDGYPGPMGSPGLPGINGEKGDPGTPGFPGPEGIPGQPGVRGYPGPMGPPGITIVGENEARGRDGYDGIPSAMGEPGLPGQKGEKGSCSGGESSFIGIEGLPDVLGIKGHPGFIRLIGEKGDKGEGGIPGPWGEHGFPGLTGQKGSTGPPGPPGTCDCKDTFLSDDGTVAYPWGSEDQPAKETCRFAPEGTSGMKILSLGYMEVFCHPTTRKTCPVITTTGQEVSYTETKPFWLSKKNITLPDIYGLEREQLSWLQRDSFNGNLTLRFHCMNIIPVGENPLTLLSLNGMTVGPESTESVPFTYDVQNDGCSVAEADTWSYTDIVLISNIIEMVPIVDFYIKDVRNGNQALRIEILELCFG